MHLLLLTIYMLSENPNKVQTSHSVDMTLKCSLGFWILSHLLWLFVCLFVCLFGFSGHVFGEGSCLQCEFCQGFVLAANLVLCSCSLNTHQGIHQRQHSYFLQGAQTSSSLSIVMLSNVHGGCLHLSIH
jgi:hypothetical protein